MVWRVSRTAFGPVFHFPRLLLSRSPFAMVVAPPLMVWCSCHQASARQSRSMVSGTVFISVWASSEEEVDFEVCKLPDQVLQSPVFLKTSLQWASSGTSRTAACPAGALPGPWSSEFAAASSKATGRQNSFVCVTSTRRAKLSFKSSTTARYLPSCASFSLC